MVDKPNMEPTAPLTRLQRALPHIGALATAETMQIVFAVAIGDHVEDGLFLVYKRALVLLAAPAVGALAVLRVRREPNPIRSPVVFPYIISFTVAGVLVILMAFWSTSFAPDAEYGGLPLGATYSIVAIAAFYFPAARLLIALIRNPIA